MGEQEKSTMSVKNTSILVVDDEKDIQNFIKFKLSKLGYNVFTADNGYDAIEKVKKFHPDLVLMDIRMPIMNGLKACEHIKNDPKLKNIPVVMVTAIGDLQSKIQAYQIGADDFIIKPIDIIVLVARVKSILEAARLREKFRKLEDKKAISDSLFEYQHLFERLETVLEKCRKEEKALSLIYLDTDFMKMINVEYGYNAGDFIIAKVREIVYDVLKDVGIILHSNSDKSFIILPYIDENKVQVYAGQVVRKIEEVVLPFDIKIKEGLSITGISVSMGLVTWDKVEKISSEKLLDLCERALKHAKEEGRGKNVQFQFFSKPEQDGTHSIDKKVIKSTGSN
ncbi:response regulator [candidate division KSB1 bacterium]